MSRKAFIFLLILVIGFTSLSIISFASINKVTNSIMKLVPAGTKEFADNFTVLVKNKQFEEAENLLAHEAKSSDTKSGLIQISDFLTPEPPINQELIGVNIFNNMNQTTTSLTYQFEFKTTWVLYNIVVVSKDNQNKILSLQVKDIPQSLQSINQFTLEGKGVFHYLVLLLFAASLLFSFYVASRIFASNMKKKWLWLIISFIGIIMFTFSWTDGTYKISPISFHMPPAGLSRPSIYAPIYISILFPLGAVISFIKLRKHETFVPDNTNNADTIHIDAEEIQ